MKSRNPLKDDIKPLFLMTVGWSVGLFDGDSSHIGWGEQMNDLVGNQYLIRGPIFKVMQIAVDILIISSYLF